LLFVAHLSCAQMAMNGSCPQMPDVKLTELTSLREFMALTAVRVKPEQRRFTRNAFITYLQTRHPAVTTYGIHCSGQLVGFVMLIHAENPTQWIIDRLTIDRDHQRQGLGYAVADQLIDMIHDFENSEMVIARYRPENDAARSLFNKLGFTERKEMFRGRHVALLEFEFEEDDSEDEADDYEEDDAESDDEEPGDQLSESDSDDDERTD